MAAVTGTSGSDTLFGTNDADIIRGMGDFVLDYFSAWPRDFIQANGGDDTIVSSGTVLGGDGNDKLFCVNAAASDFGPRVEMGNGDDFAIFNAHDFGSIKSGGAQPTFDMGDGADTMIVGSSSRFLRSDLGGGEDKILLIGGGANVNLGYGLPGLYAGDGFTDEVHLSGDLSHDVTIVDFGQNDVLYLYGSNLDYDELLQRSTISGSGVTITLLNGSRIGIFKGFDGHLSPDNVVFLDSGLSYSGRIHHGNDARGRATFIGSDADESVTAKGRFLLLSGGNDFGKGGTRNDRMSGEEGNDTLIGNDGDDLLRGGTGDDKLYGGRGNDKLYTGSGADELVGGRGRDSLFMSSTVSTDAYTVSGGSGTDRFVFGPAGLTGSVTILDFNEGEKIDLRSFSADPLRQAQFMISRMEDTDDGVLLGRILLVGVQSTDITLDDFLV